MPVTQKESWVFYPRRGARHRPIDTKVPPSYKRDFEEAVAILDVSPRMSAVLSRRILADLLEDYAKHTQFSLASRIDSFNKETSHPHELRQNLHYLREIADLSAHTQKDDQAVIVDVNELDAEWTLDIVERLFDYFIVSPERDKEMRQVIDEKLRKADRRPIKPLPDDEGRAIGAG